jgi:hypothetical protein
VTHAYYSRRKGTNPNQEGLPLHDIVELFVRVYDELRTEGYFDEAFGYDCVDQGHIDGKVKDVGLRIFLDVRKKNLWPIREACAFYNEDDLFDLIEFLYQHVSKPIDGWQHTWDNCGMHWETFNQAEGRAAFRDQTNAVLSHYVQKFELSSAGEVLHKPEEGFQAIFAADVPTTDENVRGRLDAAVLRYRRHGATLDDRRQAVRDLADVLEYLRPKVKTLLTSADENDLFNIANNFAIRHLNEKQKTSYDAALWHSWMFYLYLATIHVVLRKIELGAK